MSQPMLRGTSFDTVFVGGSVWSAGLATSHRGAVAVSGGRIAAIGDDDELLALRGPSTEVVDLAGGLLLPGFQDAHTHPVMAGVDMLRCDVHHCASADEALETIRRYAEAHPDLPWILGGGWSMSHYPNGTPTRQMLDAVVPDRPAYFPNRDGHGVWVNSRALALGGITRDTVDPSDGRIERDAAGNPTGTLHEGAAVLVQRHIPTVSMDDAVAGVARGRSGSMRCAAPSCSVPAG